ncbi:hypothetical protein [Patulibacter sp. SYSU D01012]|uniref:hypothetical protein n=1 Tax=Patulibacter sp. SYSU D01012 TaxID=2817381 RepID=UPI001B305891|nr:hypothetical protein [Patulibacter sp. SYSU D01012]
MPARNVLATSDTGVGGVTARTLKKPSATPARVLGRVTLWTPETQATATGRYSEPPQVVAERSANGAWQPITRLKRRPLSSWTGPQPVKIECKIRFGDEARRSIAGALEDLRGMQDRLPDGSGADRPPYVLVVGYVPGHYDDVKWQIDGLEITETDHARRTPVQALATVTLAEWVDSDIDAKVTKTRSAAKTKPWLKGDTIGRFAKRHLGSSGTQARQALRDANPTIHSFSKLEPGHRVKVPASTTVSS